MHSTIKYSASVLLIALLGACANTDSKPVVAEPSNEEITQLMLASFKTKGQANIDRLNQTELQQACSLAETAPGGLPDTQRTALQNAALASVKYPGDGKYLEIGRAHV